MSGLNYDPKSVHTSVDTAICTNQDEYLKDESGNRRFYPVEVKLPFVDLEWLQENRNQLFAEALYRVETLKESVHEYPCDSECHQNAKMVRSSFEDTIRDWFANPLRLGTLIDLTDGVTITDIWRFALQAEASKMRKSEEMQIGLALKQLGWERRRTMVNGEQKWRWFKI